MSARSRAACAFDGRSIATYADSRLVEELLSHDRMKTTASIPGSRRSAAKNGAPTKRSPISSFMTRSPFSIGRDQPLALAHAMMREHQIRHLPVLEAGRLAGVLSQRDLYFLEAGGAIDERQVTVDDAMSPDVYCVSPDAPLGEVATEMAERKYGCAVVMDGHVVVGVFTTVDALRALAKLAAASGDPNG